MRLFTFGCSFTNYNWPTWADLLGLEYGACHYNWGYAGLGNRAIAERLAECHARMGISNKDTVIIQWTSPLRHDYMRTNIHKLEGTYWATHGSIFSKENSRVFDYKWINTFWDEKAYLIHTLNNISLVIQFLEGIGCKWMMTSMNDLQLVGNTLSDDTFGGEYQVKDKMRKFYDVYPDLMFYKEHIWDQYQNRWADPIINVVEESHELSWSFQFDKNRDIEKSYPVKNGMWNEAHPTPRQHAIWMLKLKDDMKLEPRLTREQAQLITEIETIKDNTKTFKEFEDAITNTEWFMQRQYRGL
jgi:hypothetical protein